MISDQSVSKINSEIGEEIFNIKCLGNCYYYVINSISIYYIRYCLGNRFDS